MIQLKRITKDEIAEFRRDWEAHDKEIGIVGWNERKEVVGAFSSGKLIGYATLKINGGVGYVGELIVSKDYRGKGVGKALMEEAERICRSAGCHKITVKTSEKHAEAMALYQSIGYVTEATLQKDKFKLTWHLLCKELA